MSGPNEARVDSVENLADALDPQHSIYQASQSPSKADSKKSKSSKAKKLTQPLPAKNDSLLERDQKERE